MPYQQIVLGAFIFIAILLSVDIIADIKSGTTVEHITLEAIAFIIATIPLIFGIYGLINRYKEQEISFNRDLSQLRSEKESWKLQAQGYLRGMADAMELQFEKWGFSAAEKDIAILILKGLSHKEIAKARGTSEKTVRQQAGGLYTKSGLEGKSQLSAFFLDDLHIGYKNQ